MLFFLLLAVPLHIIIGHHTLLPLFQCCTHYCTLESHTFTAFILNTKLSHMTLCGLLPVKHCLYSYFCSLFPPSRSLLHIVYKLLPLVWNCINTSTAWLAKARQSQPHLFLIFSCVCALEPTVWHQMSLLCHCLSFGFALCIPLAVLISPSCPLYHKVKASTPTYRLSCFSHFQDLIDMSYSSPSSIAYYQSKTTCPPHHCVTCVLTLKHLFLYILNASALSP